MIPEDLIEQWHTKALSVIPDMKLPAGQDVLFIKGYIQGRSSQYEADRKEIERLKELAYSAFELGFNATSSEVFQQFKQQNNI